MSRRLDNLSVVGIDLSTKALDLVKLQDDTNRAEWVRQQLRGADAWARTLDVRGSGLLHHHGDWWDDVHLVAIEAPYGRGQAGTNAVLNRVVGAVAASLPARLRDPARCWLVAPHEWKSGLGLKGKPTPDDLYRLAPGHVIVFPGLKTDDQDSWQNARDAYCIALWAREQNAKGVAA